MIVEYHGEAHHPNPRVVQEDWASAFGKLSVEEVRSKDAYKRLIAEQQGFQFFEIYSNDDDSYKNEVIQQIKGALK